MWQSESIKEIAIALSEAQTEIKPLTANKDNPFFKSKYADLEAVMSHIKPVLKKRGLSFVQFPSKTSAGEPTLVTQIMHISGEWLRSESPLFVTKRDQQALGSAITYAKRQALQSAFGVAVTDEDDDGQSSALLSETEAKLLFKALKDKNKVATEHEFNELLQSYDSTIFSWKEIPRSDERALRAFFDV